ncbi:MAG: hypothetical protein IIC93_01900 [Chloroflexi bacterium]|nr:hypothetical protein [Chloroflexota bacterium]
MAEAGGQMVDFNESVAPQTGDRPPVAEAAPFVAQVEQLVTRVKNAKLRDDALVLENLQAWIDRAMAGQIDVNRDGDRIIVTLETNVDEMVRARTLVRRVVAPLSGMLILYSVLAGITIWAVAADTLFLGTAVSIPAAAVIFGVVGSSFRVLLRAVTFQYPQTDPGALFLLGLARPMVGAVVGLAIFAIFGSGIASLPLVSDQEATTNVAFLSFPGSGPGVLAGQLALFAIAFTGGLLEGIFIPAAGRGVSRIADTVARATSA